MGIIRASASYSLNDGLSANNNNNNDNSGFDR